MSAFRFRLERVLAWRETSLSIEEADLERLRFELRANEAALEELARREAGQTEALRHARSLSGSELAGIAGAREWMTREKKLLASRMADCLRRLDLKTAAANEARRKVRLIERLRERRRGAWIQETNRGLEELAGESALASWRRDGGRST